MNQKVNKNSSNSLAFGRWPQTKISGLNKPRFVRVAKVSANLDLDLRRPDEGSVVIHLRVLGLVVGPEADESEMPELSIFCVLQLNVGDLKKRLRSKMAQK